MMKKILSIVAALMLTCASSFASEQIPLNVNYDDPTLGLPEIGKGPTRSLTIWACFTMAGDANIRVCEGGTLVIEGGSIENADITLVPGSTLIIRDGGSIHMANGKHFYAPAGANVLIEEGDID